MVSASIARQYPRKCIIQIPGGGVRPGCRDRRIVPAAAGGGCSTTLTFALFVPHYLSPAKVPIGVFTCEQLLPPRSDLHC